MAKEDNTTVNTPTPQGWKATKEQIDQWKKDNPRGVRKFTIRCGDGIFEAYMRTPGMDDMMRGQASERKKSFTFSKSIWENCKLGFHPDIEKDDSMLLGLFLQIDETIEIADVTVEKI